MGKKKKSGSANSEIGRSLIKDRFANTRGKRMVSDNSVLHTTELQDGYDWGRMNLQSVTEESSFQEFLSTAELAGTEFEAEKLNIKFVNPSSNVGLLTNEAYASVKQNHEKFRDALKIPRRPKWSTKTSPDELDRNEKKHFLEWRRSLAVLQEEQGLILTPYEKNLEFWRQLWRVVERSDIVVQILDARNPLLFHCEDLEKYVKEVSSDKVNLLILNKADYLTKQQREVWAEYFSSIGSRIVFFSARLESTKPTEESELPQPTEDTKATKSSEGEVQRDELCSETEKNELKSVQADTSTVKECIAQLETAVQENADVLNDIIGRIEGLIGKTNLKEACDTIIQNTSQIVSKEQLVEVFRMAHTGPKVTTGITTVGLVGYPNVGKSSTINSLLSLKKLAVSATPGKTKHFQTLYLDKDLVLCDCPGLVMPSFVFTKAEMILNGILPIDQMRDYIPPINLVTSLIPRNVLESKYGIMLPSPLDGEDPDRHPTAEEFLNAYAYNRGFMTANGQPDMARAARYILKDFVNGDLLYCHPPPGVDEKLFNPKKDVKRKVKKVAATPRSIKATKPSSTSTKDIDKEFFEAQSKGVHMKGKTPVNAENTALKGEKPWKALNKHKNKCKKEKLRRVYAHLDQQ